MRRKLKLAALGVTVAAAGVLGLVGAGPSARAAGEPPVFTDGQGLTVVSQPTWVDDRERTFVFTVRSTEVPTYSVLDGQTSGEHVIMVTLPENYDASVRYPVQYHLHGHPDRPNTVANQQMFEEPTAGVPLITVAPNGSGRGWYTNWVNPPAALGLSGNGGNLTVDPVQAVLENRALVTNQVTRDFLAAADIPHTFIDYGDGSNWAEGCTGKHGQLPCLKADMKHFVALLMETLSH